MRIKYKIDGTASDELCERCPQQWLGICRAFQVPHSEEEANYRKADRRVLCSPGGLYKPILDANEEAAG